MQLKKSLQRYDLPIACLVAAHSRHAIHGNLSIPHPQFKQHHCREYDALHRCQSTGSATTADPSPHPDFTFTATPGDLLRLQLSSGQDLYFEVTKCRSVPGGGTTLEALCEGEVLRIQPNGELTHVGYLPRLSDSWVKSYPTLQAALKNLRRQQESEGTLPSTLVNAECQLQLSSSEKLTIFNKFERVASLIELESQVASNPSPWCDGTAPEDPEPTPQETALLSAGELLAFLQGNKGVQLVQLELPFVPGSRVPFPLLRPFVLRLLQRAVEAKGAVVFPSTAPGGAGATSLVLAAKQQPFKAWGARLAEVGVQAALVADSPYYKMLIGKILGYKEPNIVHHIESKGQILDPRVITAVNDELKSLSAAPAKLPWTSGRR